MKTIKAYLENQRDLAYVAYGSVLEKGGNLIDAKHWLERVIHLELMIKELENAKEKRAKA